MIETIGTGSPGSYSLLFPPSRFFSKDQCIMVCNIVFGDSTELSLFFLHLSLLSLKCHLALFKCSNKCNCLLKMTVLQVISALRKNLDLSSCILPLQIRSSQSKLKNQPQTRYLHYVCMIPLGFCLGKDFDSNF